MSGTPLHIFASADEGLLAHWRRSIGLCSTTVQVASDLVFPHGGPVTVFWLDMSLPHLPPWGDTFWQAALTHPNIRLVAASSSPHDTQAIAALDAGCAAYCHAFSDRLTLVQIRQVVEAGHVWVGPSLMQKLIQSAQRVAPKATEEDSTWAMGLTPREREIAILAANGASNIGIARQCGISERTVKAHLSAIFEKLQLTDRLQLALRVHGIN